jgi:hypothetical protein
MNRAPAYRGQPLVALLLIFGGWVAVRAMVWDAAMAGQSVPTVERSFAAGRPETVLSPAAAAPAAGPVMARSIGLVRAEPFGMSMPQRLRVASLPGHRVRLASPPWLIALPVASEPLPAALASDNPTVGQQMLWMAAFARLPPAGSMLAPLAQVRTAAASAAYRDPRWSADAWLLLRRGGNVSTASGLVPAIYGASQAGAVVRYRVAPESAHRPSLYLRASAALDGWREREAALGLSARPFEGVPLVVAAEARVNDQPAGTHVRPAAFVYSELPPIALPDGARIEVYAQAGYVGGDFATAFVDGQLRIDRRFLQLGKGELRAGGGAWGGAQKGASRLDVGPTATLGVPFGGTAGARLGVDWRFRVAGDAAPASGPAVTLSAGF